jgi:hypothetical protein
MAEAHCIHARRVRGLAQSDLSRISGDPATYTAQLTLNICQDCGQVEIYCNSHQTVCKWLSFSKANGTDKKKEQ